MDVEPLHITTAVSRHVPGTVVVTIAGELDTATAPLLYETLRELGRPPVLELDLTGVSHCSSTALSVLFRTRDELAGTVRIRAAQRPVRRIIEILRLEAAFGLQDARGPAA
ncbi:STAS domain-containing protein [Dactylosporangium sp. NPDC048998]|uniref:STAS domain-containing protein n=1 Tax=Dactylosporangium sp. NPDC048998 TaxID=3363976 RepID=UPI0037165DA7